nr:hypothetical protein [uncultured Pseudomonas sp.]
MASDEEKRGGKLVDAGTLMTAISPYHAAMARLGSGMISLASALRASDDPFVKQQADEAWQRIDEFINQMEKAAITLNEILSDEAAPRE